MLQRVSTVVVTDRTGRGWMTDVTLDPPIVQAGVLVLSTLYLTGNLLVDVLYSYLNPRIRHAGG